METSVIVGGAGVLVSLMSMLLAAMTAKHAVTRETMAGLETRIGTLENELAECKIKHRASEERYLVLMEHFVRVQVGAGD